jgi:hypothetical protein
MSLTENSNLSEELIVGANRTCDVAKEVPCERTMCTWYGQYSAMLLKLRRIYLLLFDLGVALGFLSSSTHLPFATDDSAKI